MRSYQTQTHHVVIEQSGAPVLKQDRDGQYFLDITEEGSNDCLLLYAHRDTFMDIASCILKVLALRYSVRASRTGKENN